MDVIRGHAILFPAVLFAGCLGPLGDDRPEQPPEGIPLPRYVDNGAWMSFDVHANPEFGYSWDVDSGADYTNYEVRSQDAYDCRAAATKDGWSQTLTLTSRDTASTYFGFRNDAESQWTAGQYAEVGDTSGWAYVGAPNHPDGLRVLLANETFGPGVTSWLRFNDSMYPVTDPGKGKFWCLLGVFRFPEGNYVASTDYVDAQNLMWRAEVNAGILLRVRIVADQASWRAVGPDGTTYESALLRQDKPIDETFCLTQPGAWSFQVPRLQSLPGKPWQLAVLAFDTDDPVPPCDAAWRPSILV